jgi:peptidoglycan/LPS O-acetylase OafA/YrhL
MDYVKIDPNIHPWLFTFCTAGSFGVPVFFLLSSFLIVELLLREREKTGSVHIKSFYVRRILRIWPLYFLVFYGLVIIGHFLPGIAPASHNAWWAFGFFAGNWYIMRYGWIAGPVDPLWSIAVEEQFYIAIPVLTRFGGRKMLIAVSIALLIISYIVSIYYANLKYSGESGQWVNSWFQFQFFSAGALLAIFLKSRVPRWSIIVRGCAFLFALACWLFAVSVLGVKSYVGHPSVGGAIIGWLLVLGGSVLFFLAVLGTPQQYIPKALTYLGRISFGLYMFHSLVFHLLFESFPQLLPVIISRLHLPVTSSPFIGVALTLGITIGLASLSYRFFERPFLQLKQKFTFVHSRPE